MRFVKTDNYCNNLLLACWVERWAYVALWGHRKVPTFQRSSQVSGIVSMNFFVSRMVSKPS